MSRFLLIDEKQLRAWLSKLEEVKKYYSYSSVISEIENIMLEIKSLLEEKKEEEDKDDS